MRMKQVYTRVCEPKNTMYTQGAEYYVHAKCSSRYVHSNASWRLLLLSLLPMPIQGTLILFVLGIPWAQWPMRPREARTLACSRGPGEFKPAVSSKGGREGPERTGDRNRFGENRGGGAGNPPFLSLCIQSVTTKHLQYVQYTIYIVKINRQFQYIIGNIEIAYIENAFF